MSNTRFPYLQYNPATGDVLPATTNGLPINLGSSLSGGVAGHILTASGATTIGMIGTPTVRGVQKAFYIAYRTDGFAGTGTAEDPLNVNPANNGNTDLGVIWATVVAAAPSKVIFNKATYTVAQTLHPISNCEFDGQGSTIKADPTFWHVGGRDDFGSEIYKIMWGDDDTFRGYHDVNIHDFIIDCNNQNQITPYAAVMGIGMSGYNIRIHHNKFINFGDRNFFGNTSGYEGIENFTCSIGARAPGTANYDSGNEIAYNEFTSFQPSSLYITIASMSGSVADAATDTPINYLHGCSIHHNYFYDIAPATEAFTVTLANPAVVTLSHGTAGPLYEGEPFYIGGGTLPSPLGTLIIYYARNVTDGGYTFNLSTSQTGGTLISTNGSTQSGTHYIQFPGGPQGMQMTFSVGGVMENNIFIHHDGVAVHRDTGSVVGDTIRKNIFLDVHFPIFLVPSQIYAGGTCVNANQVIENNDIAVMANVGSYGLFVQQPNDETLTGTFPGLKVRNNHVRRYQDSGSSSIGIYISSSTGAEISGNSVDSAVPDSDTTHFKISNCVNPVITGNIAPRTFTLAHTDAAIVHNNTFAATDLATANTNLNFLDNYDASGTKLADIPQQGVSDTAYDATTWDGVTTVAPSKNAIRDKIETLQPLDSDLTLWAATTPPSSYVVGDILYASAANTLSALADVATGNALISGGVTTAPSWGKITTSHTTGIAASGANVDITSLTGLTGLLQSAQGLGLRDNSAAFDVVINANSSTTLTDKRTLTLDMTNADRTLKLTGSPTLSGITTTGTGTLALSTFTLTADTTGTVVVQGGALGTPGSGVGTNLTALTAANITASTTVGRNILNLTNPGAITFIKIAADNTVSTLSATNFRTALGLGTSDVVSFGSVASTDLSGGGNLPLYADNTGIIATDSASGFRSKIGLVIGTNVQAWDADLDSWAGVTRASGFDTFTATPSVTNFKALLSDETTVVGNLLSLASPSAISFIKIAADNTVSTVAQQTAVADASGGAVIDAEARSALNALLARLRTIGIIAT